LLIYWGNLWTSWTRKGHILTIYIQPKQLCHDQMYDTDMFSASSAPSEDEKPRSTDTSTPAFVPPPADSCPPTNHRPARERAIQPHT